MEAVFVQEGGTIDYTPNADVAAGKVVIQGTLVGVTKVPIPANTLGALSVTGVYDFAKSTGVSYTVGQDLYWDDSEDEVTATEAYGDAYLGKVVKAAGSSDTTVRAILLQQDPNVV